MKNYKMVLAYDGTRYNGWQKQGNTENTIQEKLERILQEISGAKNGAAETAAPVKRQATNTPNGEPPGERHPRR